MKDAYLGDSYDLVKRFWREQLRCVAPLYFHPKFIRPSSHNRFTKLTTIPVLDLDHLPKTKYGLLLDPDTGIPDAENVKASFTHAPLRCIAKINKKLKPEYMIYFDQ